MIGLSELPNVITNTSHNTWLLEGYDDVSYVSRLIFLNGENIKLGKGVGFNYGCYLNGAGGIEIGSGSVFGPYCCIHSANHGPSHEVVEAPVKIGKNCWAGCQVVIVPGVTIGDNVRIGGGSVVTQDVPNGATVVGNPARIVV